jgi:hypothetical protein
MADHCKDIAANSNIVYHFAADSEGLLYLPGPFAATGDLPGSGYL